MNFPLRSAMRAMAAMVYLVVACMGPRPAACQGMRVSTQSHSPTVSVASLRIPDKAWRHLEKAQEAISRHHEEEYEVELKKALEIAPEFSAALVLRASQNVMRRQFDAAIVDVLKAQKADPGAMWGTVVLASAYNGLHRYRAALVLLDNLHGPEAETWQAMYELARAHIGCRDTEESLRLSAAVLSVAPKDFADVHLMRSNALLLSRRWSESLGQLQAYIASAGTQASRPDVLSAVEAVKLRMRNDEVAKAGYLPAP